MGIINLRATLFTLALAPALGGAQAGLNAAHPISLDEAVRLARQNSPTTIQSRGSLRVGGLTVTSALSQFLPSVGVSASAHNSSSASFFQGQFVAYTGPPWSYSKGYGASLALFDGGRRWFNYRAAQATQSANVENDVLAQYNVALSVKQQYYAVLAAREFEAAAERQLEQAEQDLRVSSARMSAGAATSGAEVSFSICRIPWVSPSRSSRASTRKYLYGSFAIRLRARLGLNKPHQLP